VNSNSSVLTSDGVRLHVIQVGEGPPVLFLHEYCADHRSWAGQFAELGSAYHCIAYAARGYAPSEIPPDGSAYSWQRAVDDAVDVLDALEVESAHVAGLSMGGYTAIQLGLRHPDRVRSVLAVSAGTGSDPKIRADYLEETKRVADQLRSQGAAAVGRQMGEGPSRVQLKRRSPAAWREMVEQFAGFSATGLANTIVNVQGMRPSLFSMADELARATFPLLVLNGDEDEACLPAGLMLKRTVPGCGMHVLPMTGHSPNLEQPDEFNAITRRFLELVEAGSWPTRDPRSKATLQFS
jgi:pimeloyl-ACP methyl ester carboxylesterase